MLQLAALNATSERENIAFGILKQFFQPSLPYGFTTIFGTHQETYLPFPTSIPLVNQYQTIPTPCSTTFALLESVKHSDRNSYAHSTNHAAHVYNFSYIMGLSEDETNQAYYAALLHDIGKLYYMSYVKKPGTLTIDEKNEINKHTILSYLILSSCEYPDIVRYSGLFHHYNHTRKFGYPLIDANLQRSIESLSSVYGISIPGEKSADFSHITPRQWKILSMITLLDALDAAIDPNRAYKTAVNLDNLLADFKNNEHANWNNMFDKSLEKPFVRYIRWLEDKLAE